MKESEIISCAESVKQLTKFFGGDQYIDMRRHCWRLGNYWIDFDFTKDLSPTRYFKLSWSVDSPDCYVEFNDVTLALVDVGNIEYLCLFDNEMKVM